MNLRKWLKLGTTFEEAKLLSGVQDLLQGQDVHSGIHTLPKRNSSIEGIITSSGMSRRTCLKMLLTTSLATTVDVEQLLWTPKPIVVIPGLLPEPGWRTVIVESMTEVARRECERIVMQLRDVKTGQKFTNSMRTDGMMLSAIHEMFNPEDLEAIPTRQWAGKIILVKIDRQKRS